MLKLGSAAHDTLDGVDLGLNLDNLVAALAAHLRPLPVRHRASPPAAESVKGRKGSCEAR